MFGKNMYMQILMIGQILFFSQECATRKESLTSDGSMQDQCFYCGLAVNYVSSHRKVSPGNPMMSRSRWAGI